MHTGEAGARQCQFCPRYAVKNGKTNLNLTLDLSSSE
jgi:hypothetical protein